MSNPSPSVAGPPASHTRLDVRFLPAPASGSQRACKRLSPSPGFAVTQAVMFSLSPQACSHRPHTRAPSYFPGLQLKTRFPGETPALSLTEPAPQKASLTRVLQNFKRGQSEFRQPQSPPVWGGTDASCPRIQAALHHSSRNSLHPSRPTATTAGPRVPSALQMSPTVHWTQERQPLRITVLSKGNAKGEGCTGKGVPEH